MTGLLDGAVVAVTGAASGIGRATALTAGLEGAAALILSDGDAEGLASLTAIRWSGGTHDPLPAAQPGASALNYGHH
jgi:NAD(P)-dependent dehydrogenase (short-subunit alcohol dehydrogenase family)